MEQVTTVKSTDGVMVDISFIHTSHIVHNKDMSYIYIGGETFITVAPAEGQRFSEEWKAWGGKDGGSKK